MNNVSKKDLDSHSKSYTSTADFNQVIFRSKPEPNPTNHGGFKKSEDTIADENGGILPMQKSSQELKIAIMKARTSQNLTQKQLAVKLNEQVSVIQGYENGSIIPTGLKLANLQKALDCKLPKPPKPPKQSV
tara:strand:- start:1442 stop:1837 length:396 start_codon:yes stop_codon:yes gene_type:complete